MRRQKPMTLRPYITNLDLHVVRQLALNRQVVLRGILAAHVGLELSEQSVRTEHCPVYRLISCRVQDSVDSAELRQAEWIGIRKVATLVQKGLVQQGIKR